MTTQDEHRLNIDEHHAAYRAALDVARAGRTELRLARERAERLNEEQHALEIRLNAREDELAAAIELSHQDDTPAGDTDGTADWNELADREARRAPGMLSPERDS